MMPRFGLGSEETTQIEVTCIAGPTPKTSTNIYDVSLCIVRNSCLAGRLAPAGMLNRLRVRSVALHLIFKFLCALGINYRHPSGLVERIGGPTVIHGRT